MKHRYMMTNKIFKLAFTCLLTFCATQLAEAGYLREYTKEKPLIIVSDWEFPPYEFRNDYGEPDGYNVEVLNTILDQLKIPHRYIMMEMVQVYRDIR